MDRFWEENLDGIRKWKAEALANHHCMNEWQLTLVYVLERHDTLETRVRELIGIGETQTHNLHKINADVLRLEAENERLKTKVAGPDPMVGYAFDANYNHKATFDELVLRRGLAIEALAKIRWDGEKWSFAELTFNRRACQSPFQ